MPFTNLTLRKKLLITIGVLCTSLILSAPHDVDAARTCPANLRAEPVGNAVACYRGTELVGHAEDGDNYSCPAGQTPLYDGSMLGGVNCVNADGQIAGSNSAVAPKGVDKSSCFWYFEWNKCIWDPLMESAGQFLLIIGTGILHIAGYVFDEFLKYMVVDFKKTIESTGIFDTVIVFGWTLFRDLANIAIIGVFVFVAIMTILGSGEYGAKRLIANVLVVAILLNFSLLFTRIIIEGSNFVSGKFAETLPRQPGCDGTAECFLQGFGITGVVEGTGKVVEQVAKGEGSAMALLYGLVGSLALIGIAAVLFYGAFIMAARALLLIFAMMTSSLAFASYLLPNTAAQAYVGWNAWWSNLLKAALFGPLLILFLTISMRIVQTASAKNGGDATSALASNPNDLSDGMWLSIVTLLLATGMLFIAIRAAGSFSASISGFNLAGGLPLALSSRLAGALGRNTLGWGATAMGRRTDDLLSAAKLEQAKLEAQYKRGTGGVTHGDVLQAQKAVNSLIKNAGVYDKLSKSTFSAAETRIGKQLAQTLGVAGIAGKSTSFGANAEKKAKEAAKQAEKHALNSGQKDELAKDAKKSLEMQRDVAQKQVAAAEKTLEVVRASGDHQTHTDKKAEAHREKERISALAEKEIKEMGRAGKSETEIQKRLAERNSALKEQENKIQMAHSAITALERSALQRAGIDPQKHAEATGIAKLKDEDLKKESKRIASETNDTIVRDQAARYAAGTFGSANGVVANMARDMVKKSKKEHDEGHHILAAIKKQMEHGDDHH